MNDPWIEQAHLAYSSLRRNFPEGTPITVISIGPEKNHLVCGKGDTATASISLDIGAQKTSGEHFKHRPRAHTCGCKSRRKLITANEVKRNGVRATERGEEAWIVICEPMDKHRIEGFAEQGERARDCEALVIKARWRKSGGCAAKECVLTRGDLASCLKGRRGDTEREVSRGHSSRHFGAKGRTRRSC